MAGERTCFNFKAAYAHVAETGNRLSATWLRHSAAGKSETVNTTPFYTEPEMNGKP